MASRRQNSSHVAQSGTSRELAISTRGAMGWVSNTPTGLPDWTRSVSSAPRSRREATMASKASQLRAAFPLPPYTTRSSGRSATSGSRLFMRQRRIASWAQPLHDRVEPRGARTTLLLEGATPRLHGPQHLSAHDQALGRGQVGGQEAVHVHPGDLSPQSPDGGPGGGAVLDAPQLHGLGRADGHDGVEPGQVGHGPAQAPSSANTTGLSVTLASSVAVTWRTKPTTSRAAPWTWGAQRME